MTQTTEQSAFRRELVDFIQRCEFCGLRDKPLTVHEISRGSSRQKSLDKCYAVLVLCQGIGSCHEMIHRMGGADQRALGLALLRRSRPEDFSLPSFWRLTGRREFPSEADVDLWTKRLAWVPNR